LGTNRNTTRNNTNDSSIPSGRTPWQGWYSYCMDHV
jgi:hypothetical protein